VKGYFLLATNTGADHSREERFMGRGNYEKGTFNLYVSFDYDAKRFMDEWRDGFNRASKFLFEATGGKMKFGTITAANRGVPFTKGVDPKKEADIVVYGPKYTGVRLSCLAESCDNVLPTWPYQNPCLGWAYRYFFVLHEDRWQEWYIIHEFSHYAFGLYDEYQNQLGYPGGNCCNLQNANKCIMEVCDSIVNQYCDDEHTPNNLQQVKNNESCWATIRRKYPDISERQSFSDHNITWVVM
jgi:hypothetical protein